MKKGFTLIELLIVVLIIGILVAIALPQYRISAEKAKVSKYLPLVSTMYDAVQRYYLVNNAYPSFTLSVGSAPTELNAIFDINLPDLSVERGYYIFYSGTISVGNYNNDIRIGRAFNNSDIPSGQTYCYFSTENSLKRRICAAVCGHKNLVTMFSGHIGCLVGNPNYSGI